MDLSKVTGVVFDVFNPFQQNMDTSIFVNTGAGWDYYESSNNTLKPGWNRDVTFALKAKTFKSAGSKWTNTIGIKGISVTRKLGLTFYPHQITKSAVRLDNLRFLSNEPKSVQQMVAELFPQAPPMTGGDHLLEGFEKGHSPWSAITGSSKAVGSTIVEDKKATEGTHLLKCDFDFDDKNQQAWIGIDQSLNLKDSSAIKVDIYNPNPAPLQAEIVLKLGDGYDWTESKGIQVKIGRA